LNIKKLNPPGVFKKERGKRNLGEKFDSKFYPKNYKKDVLYMNYEDLLDNLYMEKKGIDYELRSFKNYDLVHKKDENKNNNYNDIEENYSNYKKDNNFANILNDNNLNNINFENDKKEEEQDEIAIKKNNNNEFTFNQNFQNNISMNGNEINNNNILRGKQKQLKANKEALNNKITQNENNINDYDEQNLLNRYDDNSSNIQEGELKINKNENNEKENNQGINDYQKESINNENDFNNNLNESEDIRLNFVMQKLGLESLIHIFKNYHMSFNDLLFLTKDDLNELGLKIFQKNRLLSFIEEYSSKAKNYSLEEIQAFFEENNIFNISKIQE
jgi:hypothetical protein